MAIFEKIKCNITINDQAVSEYNLPSDGDALGTTRVSVKGAKVEKYVECRAEKNFAIHIHLAKKFKFKRYNLLACTIGVDGKDVECTSIQADDRENDGTFTLDCEGSNQDVNGKNMLHKFRFSSLKIEDNESMTLLKSSKKIRSLGHVSVEIWPTKRETKGHIAKPSQNASMTIREPKVSEACLKGRSVDSFVSLDAPIPGLELVDLDSRCVGKVPLVTFIFYYRSRESLQRMGIIEKPLSQRLLEDRDPATLTHEEILELLRRKEEMLRQQEDTEKLIKKRLRQEQARNNLRTLDAIKRARSLSPQDKDGELGDEEVQIVKRAKKDRKIEIVELD